MGERGGINQYGFVGNGPEGFVDPDGRELVGAGVGAAFGGIVGGAIGWYNGGWDCAWRGAVAGAVGGAVAGGTFNPQLGYLAAGAASGALGGFAGGFTGEAIKKCGSINWNNVARSTAVGAVWGGVLGELVGSALDAFGAIAEEFATFGPEAAAEAVDAAEVGTEAGGCFVRGTLVAVEGGYREIQDIRKGDRVWCYNADSSQWELRPVEATFVRQYRGDIIKIGVDGEEIEATGNHPFWVVAGEDLSNRPPAKDVPAEDRGMTESGRWVEARSLKIGDTLLTQIGRLSPIERLKIGQDSLAVYNIQVQHGHTYAVSKEGILVHNKAARYDPNPDEIGGDAESLATGASAARTFNSSDPLVGDLANEIEAAYPGHVVGVNVPIRNAAGQLVTDADIQLQNAIIQVKSGGGKGLTSQLFRTEQATGLPTIGYGPNLGPSLVNGIQQAGGLVTRDKALLIELVKP